MLWWWWLLLSSSFCGRPHWSLGPQDSARLSWIQCLACMACPNRIITRHCNSNEESMISKHLYSWQWLPHMFNFMKATSVVESISNRSPLMERWWETHCHFTDAAAPPTGWADYFDQLRLSPPVLKHSLRKIPAVQILNFPIQSSIYRPFPSQPWLTTERKTNCARCLRTLVSPIPSYFLQVQGGACYKLVS